MTLVTWELRHFLSWRYFCMQDIGIIVLINFHSFSHSPFLFFFPISRILSVLLEYKLLILNLVSHASETLSICPCRIASQTLLIVIHKEYYFESDYPQLFRKPGIKKSIKRFYQRNLMKYQFK